MKKLIVRKLRCAVYTRKSSEEGLDMEFNSLDAQREACESYVSSQKAEGWLLVADRYDDGGFSGGTLDRPALQRLLADIEACRIDIVVVYKIDRLSRSLMDFAKLVEVFDRNSVTFVSVTQSFNTTTSMGRLTLNIHMVGTINSTVISNAQNQVYAHDHSFKFMRQDPKELGSGATLEQDQRFLEAGKKVEEGNIVALRGR
jgi:hypothetical protein